MNNNSVVEKEFEHDGYGRLFKSTINGSVKFYLYDTYGNPTSIGGVAATWTSGTLLSSFGSTSYSYNHKGVRYSKTWTDEFGTYTSNYYLDGARILGEDSKGRKLRYFYDVTGLTGLTVDGVKHRYVKDVQGNATKIYRLSDNQLAAAYVYDAWGNHTITCNINGIADLNPFRYRSYYYDVETGYYYLQSRYYNPQIGRFISPDTIDYMDFEDVNSLDLYRYCLNNPVMLSDSSGCSPFWDSIGNWFKDHWKEVVIGAAFIVAGALVTALTAGAGVGFMAAFGSALLSSTIQVGISMATSVVIGGLISVANGGGFFDNVGDSLASGFMWGGIFAGGAQIIGGGFRLAANMGAQTGRNGGIAIGKSGLKVLSADKNSWAKAGGTLIKFGKAARFDIGAMWGFHAHIALTAGFHWPIGSILAGIFGGI